MVLDDPDDSDKQTTALNDMLLRPVIGISNKAEMLTQVAASRELRLLSGRETAKVQSALVLARRELGWHSAIFVAGFRIDQHVSPLNFSVAQCQLLRSVRITHRVCMNTVA